MEKKGIDIVIDFSRDHNCMVTGRTIQKITQFLKSFFPDPSKGKNLSKRIMEAGAIAA